MELVSCQSCGVVIDFSVPAMDREDAYSHDGDRTCEAVKCPICKELILDEKWKDVG